MAIITLNKLPKSYRDHEVLNQIVNSINHYFEEVYRKGETNDIGDPILVVYNTVILDSEENHYIFNVTVKNNEYDEANDHKLTQEELKIIHDGLRELMIQIDDEHTMYIDNSMSTITCIDTANPYQFLNLTVIFEFDFLDYEDEQYLNSL